MRTREMHHENSIANDNHLTDIHLSGGYHLELMERNKPVFDITFSNYGRFIKADLNGKPLTKEETYDILGIKSLNGYRIDFYINRLIGQGKYRVEAYEKDVT